MYVITRGVRLTFREDRWSSLKRFGQGPSWSPVVTVSQSASLKDALVQDYIMPGPLTNVAYVGNGIYYYPMTGDFAGIVHLDLPQGWDDSSLSFEFDDNPTMQCPSLYNVPKLEFLSLPPKNMTTHIQHAVGVKVHGDGFGCVFHSRVRAVSRCGVKGMWTNVTVNLKVNPPGNVKNVTLRADLHYVQARLRINWSPPDDLGSTGILDHYLMRWGKVRLPRPEDLLAQPKYIEDSQTKLDRTIIEFEVWVPKENDISYGFQIVPLAPNQPFKSESWGLFQLFTIPIKYDNNHHHHTNGTSTGHPLSDQDVSIVQIPNSLNISVIWSYAEFNKSKRSFNDHYLVQYGEVDSENAQSFRSNNTCTKIISPFNQEIMASIDYSVYIMDDAPLLLSLNKSHTLYGIKILGYPLGTEDDGIDEERENETMFTFSLDEPNITDSSDELLGLAVLCGVLAATVLIVAVVCRLHRYKREKLSSLHQRILDNSDIMTNPYNLVQKRPIDVLRTRSFSPPVVPDAWEVPHSCVKVGRTLGKGAFGEVLKGRVSASILKHRNVKVESDKACGLHVPVAVKMLKEEASDTYKEDFLREIRLMKEIGYHKNIVSMLGCCTLQDPVCLIVEHLPHGDLLTYLRNIRQLLHAREDKDRQYVNSEVESLSPTDLMSFARQIAIGMEFLSQKGFVHRDLAARNVLVGADKNVKIGDFGLTRFVYNDQIYINRNGGKLPLKWMSVEAIFELTFSTASDVWSYGIVLFEIVTLGGTPYPTIDTRDLLRELKNGYRMEKPDNCSEQIYQIMRSCWRENPHDRPTFTKLRTILDHILEADSGLDYFNYQIEGNGIYYQVQDGNDHPQQGTTNSDIKVEDLHENNVKNLLSEGTIEHQKHNANTIVCKAEIENVPKHYHSTETIPVTGHNDEGLQENASQFDNACGKNVQMENTKLDKIEENVCKTVKRQSETESESSDSTITRNDFVSRNAEEFDADMSSFSSDSSSRRQGDDSSNGDDDVFLADDENDSPVPYHLNGCKVSRYNLRPQSIVHWNEKTSNFRARAQLQHAASLLSEQNDSGVSTSSVHDGQTYSFPMDLGLNLLGRPRVWSNGEVPNVRGTCTETSSCGESDAQSLSTYI
ncbi:hypothetical protein FSP39_012370 [Pinctada imbricata]|uniref:Protein kinase domain-containing protein n=1 Tax=Pinctada imbricata TaxID=66713 RepID=A0AA88Y3B2_PINIB|nr:hypothetical protein FSP39_012370 [Pinctada imbricata]